eukprot:4134747-Karenia_brevis.AAC.1
MCIRDSPKEERWGEDCLRWVPWKKYEGGEEADGEVPEGVKDEERDCLLYTSPSPRDTERS